MRVSRWRNHRFFFLPSGVTLKLEIVSPSPFLVQVCSVLVKTRCVLRCATLHHSDLHHLDALCIPKNQSDQALQVRSVYGTGLTETGMAMLLLKCGERHITSQVNSTFDISKSNFMFGLLRHWWPKKMFERLNRLCCTQNVPGVRQFNYKLLESHIGSPGLSNRVFAGWCLVIYPFDKSFSAFSHCLDQGRRWFLSQGISSMLVSTPSRNSYSCL